MNRDEMVLTREAQFDRDDFDMSELDGCTCFISPPCNFCTHPGNPRNQDECDECWEPEDFGSRIVFQLENLRLSLHRQIDQMKGRAA